MNGNIRILLINPPHTGRMIFPSINDRIAFRMHDFAPPLGLLYIKSYLEKNTRSEVSLFNFQTPAQPTVNQFIGRLAEFEPDIAAISVVSPFWYGTCLVNDAIRRYRPDTVIVGGGPHMWTYPEETLIRGRFDITVQGQGEKPMAEIVRRVAQSRRLEGIPGTTVRVEGQVVQTPPAWLDQVALDALPFPDRSLLDIRQHRFSVNRHHPCALMVASRGCPYNCSFCNNRERYFLPRNPALVVEEMLACKQMGYRSIQFSDDVFTCSREHVIELCRMIRSAGVGLPWSCQTRVDCLDRKMLAEMASADCERIQFGIESANPYTLQRINKHISPEQILGAFSLCRERGVMTIANIIIGFPWETHDDIRNTFNFVFSIDPDYVFCNPLIPFPGTQIFDEAANDPNYDSEWFKRFVREPKADSKITLWTAGISEDRICTMIKSFYRRYYFHPRRLKRYLLNLTGPADIIGKFATGMKLIVYR
jgi:radical SAM superfamily enzyme YgiQ (UPF0313 family)